MCLNFICEVKNWARKSEVPSSLKIFDQLFSDSSLKKTCLTVGNSTCDLAEDIPNMPRKYEFKDSDIHEKYHHSENFKIVQQKLAKQSNVA